MPRAYAGLGMTTGLAADRAALSSPVAGQQFYETDTGIMYCYTGSAWRAVSATTAATGGVLRVVQAVKTDTFASTPGALWTNVVGLSVSITPYSSSSKFLVTVDLKGSGAESATTIRSRLVRDGNPIYVGDAASSRPRSLSMSYGGNTSSDGAKFSVHQMGGTFLDSPNTAAQITYAVQIGGDTNNLNIFVNRTVNDRDNAYYDGRCASSLTVMELAA